MIVNESVSKITVFRITSKKDFETHSIFELRVKWNQKDIVFGLRLKMNLKDFVFAGYELRMMYLNPTETEQKL